MMSFWVIVITMNCNVLLLTVFFFFKHKTAYEMRISDWSSDVCSSDLVKRSRVGGRGDSLGLNGNKTLADRRLWAFLLGVVAVTIGVLLHLPMFWKIGRASCRERVCQYV